MMKENIKDGGERMVNLEKECKNTDCEREVTYPSCEKGFCLRCCYAEHDHVFGAVWK